MVFIHVERERERESESERATRLVRGNKCVEDMSAIPVCGMSKETVHYIVISTVTLCNNFIDNCLYIYKMCMRGKVYDVTLTCNSWCKLVPPPVADNAIAVT